MDHGLKQRLIGATVLVSLAVIFVPMLVGEDPQRSQEIDLDIPPFPEKIESKILPLPEQAPEELAQVEIKSDAEAVITAPTPAPKASVEPTPSPKPTASNSFAVQVGSFSSQSNADGFSKTLQKSGYKAFVDRASVDGKTTYKVLVGPEVSKEKAAQISEQLKKEQQVTSTWVVPYPG